MPRLLLALLSIGVSAVAQTPAFDGHWFGTLDAGAAKLRLAVHIEKGADGALTGKMDSIDQGANGIPLSAVTAQDKAFSFKIPSIAGSYKGTMNATGDAIEGTWSQGPGSLPLAFKRTAEAVDTSKPQDPKKP